MRRAAAERRSNVLRRLPARRTGTHNAGFVAAGAAAGEDAGGGAQLDGQRAVPTQARAVKRKAAARENRVGAHAREARPRGLQAGDTAAASIRHAAADEGGDGAICDDVREDSAGVRATRATLASAQRVRRDGMSHDSHHLTEPVHSSILRDGGGGCMHRESCHSWSHLLRRFGWPHGKDLPTCEVVP